jgi:hypothetical protein
VTPRVRLLLLVVGLGLFVILVRQVGVGVVLSLLVRVGWRFLIISGIYGAYVGIRAAALWRVMLERPLPYMDVLRIRLSTEAIEMLTFTGPFLAEPAKGWLLTRRGTPTSAAFGAVITEYLVYSVVSSCLAVVALVLLLTRHALPVALRPAAVLILVLTVAFIAAFLFASSTGIGLIVPILRGGRAVVGERAGRIADQFQRIETVIIEFLHGHVRRLAEVFAIETAAHAVLVVEVWAVIVVLGFSLSWMQALVIEGGVKFVGIVFAFIPGQLGASEGTYEVLTKAVGLPTAVGLTVALVRRLRGVLVAIVGLIGMAVSRD